MAINKMKTALCINLRMNCLFSCNFMSQSLSLFLSKKEVCARGGRSGVEVAKKKKKKKKVRTEKKNSTFDRNSSGTRTLKKSI